MIADPLWSCVMFLCGPVWSFVGPLRYLVIPHVLLFDHLHIFRGTACRSLTYHVCTLDSSLYKGIRGKMSSPSPAGSWELPKSEEKKLEVEWGYRIILAKQITLKYVF